MLFRQIGMVDLIPANHLPVVLHRDRLQLAFEIRLQRVAVRQFVVVHKRLDRSVRFPLAVVNLIAANMQMRIREDRARQFADHRVNQGMVPLWLDPAPASARPSGAPPAKAPARS